MLRAKAEDAAKQSACRGIFRRRTLRGVAGQHPRTGPRRIPGVGADGGVVPFSVEDWHFRYCRNTLVCNPLNRSLLLLPAISSVRQERKELVPYVELAGALAEKPAAEKEEARAEAYTQVGKSVTRS